MARQNVKKTGWPAGLLQDDDGRLSRWFASRPDARYVLKRNLEKDMNEKPTHFTDNHAVSMTLRDYFAAKTMASLTEYFLAEEFHLTDDDWMSGVADDAYRMADAMMKARGQ
jgi:hypothetical protein